MSRDSRLAAALVYIPVFGWLYVFFFQRKNALAVYHLRQSVGLFLFLAASLAVWAVVAWLLAWIPYAAVLSIALFAIVVVVYIYGAAVWVQGLLTALHSRTQPLPLFGRWADRLPIR